MIKVSDFLPTSHNFSELGDDGMREIGMVEDEGIRTDGFEFEVLILNMIKRLSDKERIIFLFQVLKSDNYRMSHVNCASALGISLSWYKKTLVQIRKKINCFNTNKVA